MSDPEPHPEETTGSWWLSLLIAVGALGGAAGVTVLIFSTEPTAEKGGATKKTAMLVDVQEVERDTYRPELVAQGTVEPAREIALRPQVDGRVTSISDSFTPGGHVEKGDLLVRIESADYRNALAQRKSELKQAQSDLAVEKGRHEAARAEYDRFGEELSDEEKSRVLREPQLAAARERVEAARAAVEQAKLNISRTTLEAPFDAHILERTVNVGSQISSNEDIGRLVGTDAYWIEIDLPMSKLQWVTFGDEKSDGSTVHVRNRESWPPDARRTGRLTEKVGALDGDTRMARVLATIPDPLAREADATDKPALTIGAFVEATIRGRKLEDVVRLERDYLRDGDTVWTMEDGKLRIREVAVALRDSEYAYVTDGLPDGSRVVTTNLSTPTDGAPLRLKNRGEEASGE